MTMPLSERQERELRAALLTTRILGLAMCYGGPVAYALAFGFVVLGGHWELLFQGLAGVPWGQPLVLILLGLSATTLAGVFLLPALLARQSDPRPLSLLRSRSILAFALLEAIAIYGLVLGFALGPTVAPLSLGMILIPPLFGLLVQPREEDWRQRLEAQGPHA